MREMVVAEMMKIRTRWLLYVILVVMFIGAALQIWLAGVVAYHLERGDPEFGPFPPGLRTFAFPWSLHALLDSGQFWGGILVGFLVASAVATEYNWGTARGAVVRGQSRARFLAAKVLGTGLIASAMLLAAYALGIGFSLIATVLEDEPITLDVRGGPSPIEIPLMILRAGWGVLPYAMLAFALSVIGRSTTIGATGVLVYKIIEMITLPIFNSLGGVWADLQMLFVGHHADALIAANRYSELDYNAIAFRETPRAAELPDPLLSFIVITGYTLLFAAAAFYVFQRRDLNARNE